MEREVGQPRGRRLNKSRDIGFLRSVKRHKFPIDGTGDSLPLPPGWYGRKIRVFYAKDERVQNHVPRKLLQMTQELMLQGAPDRKSLKTLSIFLKLSSTEVYLNCFRCRDRPFRTNKPQNNDRSHKYRRVLHLVAQSKAR